METLDENRFTPPDRGMSRAQALARGYKLGDIHTIGDIRGAAFDLCQRLRGTDHGAAASIVHDAVALALPSDPDAPILPRPSSSIFAPSAPDGYASLADMLSWARRTIYRRDPDVVITSPSNPDDYLRRWWFVPRNAFANVYLHQFLRSDDDRALHDHPWANTSWLLEGEYIEHTPEGVFHRRPGDFVAREAGALHRSELIDGQPVISLFTTGPKVRDWGFACAQGWVPWQVFTAPGNAGCGA